MRRIWAGLGMAIALAAITAGGVVISQDGGGAPEGMANIWIDTNGGTCTYSATEVAYVDAAACGTMDAAWDAMSNGDTARMVAGTYPDQEMTGSKTARTYIIGDPNGGVVISDRLLGGTASDNNYLWLENVEIAQGNSHANGSGLSGDNSVWHNVDVTGQYPVVGISGNGAVWEDSTYGDASQGIRTCGDSEWMVWLDGDNVTIDNVDFSAMQNDENPPSCLELHLEKIRIQGAQNFTLKNSHLAGGGDEGSGHVFVTGGTESNGTHTFINNYFGQVNGSYAIQVHGAVTLCDWDLYYNTFIQSINFGCSEQGSNTSTYIGNLGAQLGCGTDNVWSGSGGCGGDTYVAAPFSNLGIAADGSLNVGSPAIDAAETPGASDVCTGAVGSVDNEGTVRPQGSVCDAGWDER